MIIDGESISREVPDELKPFRNVKKYMSSDGNYKNFESILISVLKDKGISEKKINKKLKR